MSTSALGEHGNRPHRGSDEVGAGLTGRATFRGARARKGRLLPALDERGRWPGASAGGGRAERGRWLGFPLREYGFQQDALGYLAEWLKFVAMV